VNVALASPAFTIKETCPERLQDLPFGDFVPLTRFANWCDGERKAQAVYVNRRNVAYVAAGRNSTTIHLVGGGTLEVTESLREVAAACS
jgi:DNA-binding LytR/AlgR family response regulator